MNQDLLSDERSILATAHVSPREHDGCCDPADDIREAEDRRLRQLTQQIPRFQERVNEPSGVSSGQSTSRLQ
jgi:hypothetical protein